MTPAGGRRSDQRWTRRQRPGPCTLHSAPRHPPSSVDSSQAERQDHMPPAAVLPVARPRGGVADRHHHEPEGRGTLAAERVREPPVPFRPLRRRRPPPLRGCALPTAEALRALTDAPKDEIPNSARISVLTTWRGRTSRSTVRAGGVPRSRELGGRRQGSRRGRAPEGPRRRLVTERPVPHHPVRAGSGNHEVAFIGESVCTVQKVKVEACRDVDLLGVRDGRPVRERVGVVDPRQWPILAPFISR